MVADCDGIKCCRTVKRIPEEKRWSRDCVDWVCWAPWNRYRDAVDADGDVPEGVPTQDEEKEDRGEGKERTVCVDVREKVPRDFYISKKDAERHGYTRGCGGCSSWFKGLGRQPHTEACRARFRDLMKDEAKVRNQEARRKEFEDRGDGKRMRKDSKEEPAGAKEEGEGSLDGKDRKRKEDDTGFDEKDEDRKEIERALRAQVAEDRRSKRIKTEVSLDQEEDADLLGIEASDGERQEVLDRIYSWIAKVEEAGLEDEGDSEECAWDDVHGGEIPLLPS